MSHSLAHSSAQPRGIRFFGLAPLAIALALGAGAVSAQSTGGATGTTSGTTSGSTSGATAGGTTGSQVARADAAFMKQAAQNNQAEIEGSQMALQKSSRAEVKTFAQQMIDDHTKTGQEMATLAASKGVDIPKEPSVAQRAKAKLMQAMDGDRFDRRYADSIGVTAHQDTVKLFRKASTDAKDPDVKAFAAKTLPALEHHLQMAQQLKSTVDQQKSAAGNGSGAKMTTSGTTTQ